MVKKKKSVLTKGAISPEIIAQSIAHHSVGTDIGAHDIFLGQVRADTANDKTVTAIEYTAYEEMAEAKFSQIRESAFAKFDLICLHILHSLGKINAGEICLFVFTSSAHRTDAMAATRYIVEEIKADVPVFGKEIFDNKSHQWKVNK